MTGAWAWAGVMGRGQRGEYGSAARTSQNTSAVTHSLTQTHVSHVCQCRCACVAACVCVLTGVLLFSAMSLLLLWLLFKSSTATATTTTAIKQVLKELKQLFLLLLLLLLSSFWAQRFTLNAMRSAASDYKTLHREVCSEKMKRKHTLPG